MLDIDCPKSGPGPDQTPNVQVQVQLVSGPDLGSGPNLVMNSPKKSLQNKPKNIFFGQLLTYKDMDKTIKISENSRCTQIIS